MPDPVLHKGNLQHRLLQKESKGFQLPLPTDPCCRNLVHPGSPSEGPNEVRLVKAYAIYTPTSL